MTVIQQVLFEVESPYLGHPYFVTGNALFNAIARRVDERTRRALHVSHGVFVPGEYGEYPAVHSQDGYGGKLGQSLPAVETYDDVFVFRDVAQRWLLESRPREAHNTHDLERHGARVAFAPRCFFGKPAAQRNTKRSVQWFVHCYLHAGTGQADVVPVCDEVLDGIRVGGARNYGFGELSLADSQVVALGELDFSRLRDAEETCLRLVTPYVTGSEVPGADGQSVPWWWDVSSGGLRRRETRLVSGDESFSVETVDHGQVVEYVGDDVVRTAKNGVTRVGTHSKFGFGEFRLRRSGADRVPERAAVASDGGGV